MSFTGPVSACIDAKLTVWSHLVQVLLDETRKRDLQNTIQAHFRDWLVQTGAMRQVYDLARMERGGEGSSTP